MPQPLVSKESDAGGESIEDLTEEVEILRQLLSALPVILKNRCAEGSIEDLSKEVTEDVLTLV